MKTMKIQIPDGKTAEWVNGVLTLVDELVIQPVTERIKTFEDACDALGKEHPLVHQYHIVEAAYRGEPYTQDLIAFLKLRVITAALNEGWEPECTKDEPRWNPWFQFYTKKEIDAMGPNELSHVVLRDGCSAGTYCGVACVNVYYASLDTGVCYGSRLVFKSSELARYAGKQFKNIYADFFMNKPQY